VLQQRTEADSLPLVVDLDGTLVAGDIAMESLITVARRNLRSFLCVLALVLFASRARLKAYLALHDPVDPEGLAFRPAVLDLIAQARAGGRPVILASAAHQANVRRVAHHLGLFDAALGSTSRSNLRGKAKLDAIRATLGEQRFDYVGDSMADRPIWQAARTAYTAGIATGTNGGVRLHRGAGVLRSLVKAVRPHQWAKNALVLVPLVTSGGLLVPAEWGAALLAMGCLCVIASSVYLLNDVLDLRADRRHKTKRNRPVASGELGIGHALLASATLAAVGLGVAAALLSPLAALAIAAYFGLTLAYSLRIKSAMIADVLALAALYTMRLIVGAAAIGVMPSMWLLIFSIFFFLSLGYLKRFVELNASELEPERLLSGRGYLRGDCAIVGVSGLAAGIVSVLVILLFAAEMADSGEYAVPQLLWLLAVPLLYWINRVWIMATRGEVDGDPVAFALTDRRSLVVAAVLGMIALGAKYGTLTAVEGLPIVGAIAAGAV